jgi:hypothetical protein
MENRFCVEAKTFLFSVEEGKPVLRVEESRKGFTGVVLLDLQVVAWAVAMGGEALRPKCKRPLLLRPKFSNSHACKRPKCIIPSKTLLLPMLLIATTYPSLKIPL